VRERGRREQRREVGDAVGGDRDLAGARVAHDQPRLDRGAEQRVREVRRRVVGERAEHADLAGERVAAVADRPHAGLVARDRRRDDREQQVIVDRQRAGQAPQRAEHLGLDAPPDRARPLARREPRRDRADHQLGAEPRADLRAGARAAAVAHRDRPRAAADPARRGVLAVARRREVAGPDHRRRPCRHRVHLILTWCTKHTKSSRDRSRPRDRSVTHPGRAAC
jgi:hypothetical protein